MAVPKATDARLYYRCAFQRHDDAQVLRKAEHTTGAVYLAGYGVECILKALILMAVPAKRRAAIQRSFRGGGAHDYEWLRTQYYSNGGSRFPREVNHSFTLVSDWSTELRYTPRVVRADDADAFLNAAEVILYWADERL